MKKEIVEIIVKIRQRMGRGRGYYGDIREFISWAVALKVFGFSWLWIVPLGILGHIGFYLLGYIDERKLKIWQREAVYNTKDVNPFLEQIGKDVERLKGEK